MKWFYNITACFLCAFLFFNVSPVWSQETNSYVSGRVLSDKKETFVAATVTVIHEPTQNRYISLTRNDGYFHFFNLKPGGPYSIIISYVGYKTLKEINLYINLNSDHFAAPGKTGSCDFILEKKSDTLEGIIINSNNLNKTKNGAETNISYSTLQSLPSVSRSFQDFIRLVPQAKVTGDGVMSLAGQNNRFNAFFIDGANNNDILGLSANGTNGGQTGSPPVSIEAIEEIKVLLAPYDVQYGNFTGGSINAITRSGSNETKASAWYYFRNENLAGRSPVPIERQGSPGEFYRPRLSHFVNQTAGAWLSGPLVKNKVFYFALLEKQSDVKPQPFDYNEYLGTSNQQQINALADSLRSKYKYEPGSFLETKDELDATRLVLKFDWNASVKNKFMLSYRYNDAERSAPRVQSSATSVIFQNNGFILPAKTHTASLEWKHFFKKDMNNRLLFTYTNELDDRKWIGQPFPRVTIFDGIGSVVFGSDANSAVNIFKATDIT
ncbi:MAG: carboxypeptidase regulatory-like domain-containing protein, partial [Bacteroidota bacterium]